MRLLFLSLIKNAKHFTLGFLTILTLFCFTAVNQAEMFALGVLINTGTDFFTLFGKREGKSLTPQDEIAFTQIEQQWKEVDVEGRGSISKRDAALFLAKHEEVNLFNRYFQSLVSKLDWQQNFTRLLLVLLIVASFKAFFLFFSRYSTQLLSIRITKDLRRSFFEHLQQQPMSFYQEYNLGSLSSRAVGDAGQIASSLNSCLVNYFHTPFTLITTLILCVFLSWQLSLVIFVGMPLVIYPVILVTKRVKKVGRQIQQNQEKFTSVLLDFIAGIQTIKVYAMEGFSLKKFNEENEKMAHLQSKSARYDLLTRPILHTVTTFCLVTVALFGLYTLHMSIAQLITFCGLLHIFYEPVKKLAEENANIQKGIIAAERMFEVLHLRPAIEDRQDARDLKGFREKVCFEDVWFKYDEKWVLKSLSFTLYKGETLAIVGPTGSGKSTLVQLLVRLFEPQRGKITIDDQEITSFTQKSLREAISYVPQHPFLFYDTVEENISFGRSFPHEHIVDAAKRAYADEFIKELPQGYRTLLAEMGKSLSGGQKQRLAIARALVKGGEILVMDEATSSLDVLSENRIKDAMQTLHKEGMTQIIIAHRLSTIEHADRILYLDQGVKIAEGTLSELLATSPPFRLMWEAYCSTQFSSQALVDQV